LGERTVQAARAELWIAEGRAAEALGLLDRLDATLHPGQGRIVPILAKLRADALLLTGDFEDADRLYVAAAARAQEQGSLAEIWRIHAARCAMFERSATGRVREGRTSTRPSPLMP
jgi:hypothetical protein